MLNALDTLGENGLTYATLDVVIGDLLEADEITDGDDKLCLIALAYCRSSGGNYVPSDCSVSHGNTVRVIEREYLVYTEDERDAAFAEALDQAADSVCESFIVEMARRYFDREQFKSDAEIDGAGCYLAAYDGEENKYDTGPEVFYLYRTS